MNSARSVSFCTTLALCIVASLAHDAHAAPPATNEEILKIWKAREDKVATARFTWEKREIINQGTYTRPGVKNRLNDPGFQPPTDITLSGNCKLSIGRGVYRYNYDGFAWSVVHKQVRPHEVLSTFDGKTYKQAAIKNVIVDHPEAVIKSKLQPSEVRDLGIRPLWLAVRGQEAASLFGFALFSYQPTGRSQSIDGSACFEYTSDNSQSGIRSQLFLDPNNDYRLVRMTNSMKATIILKIDVRFQQHADFDWLPLEWEYIAKDGNGRVQISVKCKLTSAEFNPRLDADETDATLPPGTRVSDLRGEKEIQFVVRDNGDEGQGIPLEGKLITYDQLIEANKRTFPWRSVLLIGSASVTFLSATALLWRRIIRNKAKRLHEPPATGA